MSQIIDSLRTLNPHWAKKPIIGQHIVKRTVLEGVLDTLKLRQLKDILGIRRSGKTTLLYLIIDYLIQKGIEPSKIFFLSFDNINLNTSSFDEIEKAISEVCIEPEYLFLDEAQEKKGWERWVKQMYDLRKFKQIFVSGSNASLLSKDVGQLLTGRHTTTIMFPFSFKEYLYANGWDNFDENYLLSEKNKLLFYLNKYLKNGSFPETVNADDNLVVRVLSDIYNDIISRDIAARHRIEREKIDLLAKFLFSNITKEYSYNSLAKSIGINIETVEKYLSYLTESFLFSSLNMFSYKLKVQYKQNKKIYAIDTGLRNSIYFGFSRDLGKLYENAVFIELKRRNQEIYYWKGKGEVDFVVREGLKIKEIIQVCQDISDEKTKKREINSLIEAAKALKIKKGIIITDDTSKEDIVEDIKIKYIPLWKWLIV